MSDNGLSNSRLEQLRRQREEERRKKAEAEQQNVVQQPLPEQQKTEEPKPEQAQVEEQKQQVEQQKVEQSAFEEPIQVKANETDLINNRPTNVTNVNIIGEDSVLVQNNTSEEDGKVQVGYTMVDESLVKEAKDNKRYGIKERSDLYKKLNTVVFYVAIPFMLLWIVLAFAGICTARQQYPSFANNIYHVVDETIAINGYENGDILNVKAAERKEVKVNDVICVKYSNEKGISLHFLRVTKILNNSEGYPEFWVIVENENDTILNNKYSGEENIFDQNIVEYDVKFMGIVTGKDLILGRLIIFSQNIVVFIFLVVVPLIVILTFQIINLYDGIRIYNIQKKIAKSTTQKEDKPVEDRDKIVR